MNRHFPDNMPSFYKNRFCRRKTEESLSVSVTVSLEEEGRERGREREKKGRSQDFKLNFRIIQEERVSVLYATGKEDKKNH